jgi:hypothetical protein
MNLNRIMDIDHVVYIDSLGRVTDAEGMYGPEVIDSDGTLSLSSQRAGWTVLDGYSGQYGYSGPVMHPSEYIGGSLARDIVNTPGFYVALIVLDDDEDEHGEHDIIGWIVATIRDEE